MEIWINILDGEAERPETRFHALVLKKVQSERVERARAGSRRDKIILLLRIEIQHFFSSIEYSFQCRKAPDIAKDARRLFES